MSMMEDLFPPSHVAAVDDEDDVLQDMGFFGAADLTKAHHNDDAQAALNELGLNPSPPRRRLGGLLDEFDDDPGSAFDLDRELEMEEMQRQEEASQPTPYDLEEDVNQNEDEVLESNGALAGAPDEELDSSPLPTPPPQDDALAQAARVRAMRDLMRGQAQASSSGPRRASPALACVLDAALPAKDEDDDVGMNGIPRYIPSGVTHVALLDGSTVSIERRKRVNAWKPKPVHYGTGAFTLLSRPVHRIVERVEALAALQAVKNSEARVERDTTAVRPLDSSEMWQERYRPTRFTELVGEDRTHREVLTWIKSWDKCVYGRRTGSKKRFRDAEPKAANYGNPNGLEMYKDKWDRPKERILLLGGPAGMGKTTLAHVVARTSGYLVHEINASDERTASTVEDRIRDALESNSLLSTNKSRKPTCLILDEVDGATGGGAGDGGSNGGGFIRALIKLIEQGAKSSGGVKKRGGKKGRPLLRPIVCICNDPYAASLRALRPYSKLLRLNRPSTPALMARMRQICERESIKHDTAGLNMLVGLCQGDVRSCLNALQLVRTDPRGVTVAALQGGRIADANGEMVAPALSIKDGNSNIHQVWQQLFRTQTSRERDRQRGAKARALNNVAAAAGHDGGEGAGRSDSHEVVSSVMSSGEMDKILAGCFEHYPNLKLVDDGWQRFHKMHEWVHWYEYINHRGWEIGNPTEMWGYLPWSFVCWRTLFANTGNELPAYPRIDYQNHLKRTAFDEMTVDVRNNLPPMTRSQFDKTSLVTELGPMLVPLLSPEVKPINLQLVKAEEKATMAASVAILYSLGIDFVLDTNEQGHSYLRFEPPLEAFAHFEGKRVEGSGGGAARFNVRQMMTTELRAMRLRERQAESGTAPETASEYFKGKGRTAAKAAEEAKSAIRKAGGAVDFFGRPIVPKVKAEAGRIAGLPESILARRREKENVPPLADGATAAEECDDDEDASHPSKRLKIKVFYHYHEGYSNAVRKPIKMSALLSS